MPTHRSIEQKRIKQEGPKKKSTHVNHAWGPKDAAADLSSILIAEGWQRVPAVRTMIDARLASMMAKVLIEDGTKGFRFGRANTSPIWNTPAS